MIVSIFIFAIMFLACAVALIISVVVDSDPAAIVTGFLTLVTGAALAILSIVLFAAV